MYRSSLRGKDMSIPHQLQVTCRQTFPYLSSSQEYPRRPPQNSTMNGGSCTFVDVGTLDEPQEQTANGTNSLVFSPTLHGSEPHKQRSSGPHRQPPAFLNLPAEVRLAIYQAALIDKQVNTSLLHLCRQVGMEAQEILYKRHASFDAQAKLFAWIRRSRTANLSRVRSITIRLTDVDLSALLEPPTARRQTRTSIWTLYKDDLEKLEQSLSSLPNLARLTVTPPRIGRSSLLRGLYHEFLSSVPKRCPRLRHLDLHDTEEVLECVPEIKTAGFVTRFVKTSTTASIPRKSPYDPNSSDGRESKSTGVDTAQQSGPTTRQRSTWAKTVLG